MQETVHCFRYRNNMYEEDDSTEIEDPPNYKLTGKKGRNCNHDDLKCTTHHEGHWKTPPYWPCKSL